MATLKLTVDVAVPGMEGLTKVTSELEGIEAASSKTGSTMTGIFQGIGQSIASFGIGLVTSGISAAVDQIGNSITLASDKAEAASKVNVLFGESADVVTKASEGSAEAVGLSSGAYLAAAGDLGNLTTNLGYTSEEAANMSVDMLALAADMGSFNNASTEDVTAAMGAAFRGETEPIRRFGVMLDDAAVKAKAVEMGLYSGIGAIDKNAKAQATYALILEQTTAAQGDFARTSDGLANTQKISAARMEDAWVRVGEVLAPIAAEILPLIADAIVGLIDIIMDIAGAIGEWIDDNAALVAELQKLGGMIADYVVWAFGIWMDVIGELGYRLGALIGIIIDIMGAIVDFGDAIIRALSGDFEGAAAAAERGLGRIGAFAENVQRVMGDAGRRASDEAILMGRAAEEATADAFADMAETSDAWWVQAGNAAANGGALVGRNFGEYTAEEIANATPRVGAAADTMADTIPEAMTEAEREAARIAAMTPGEIAAGIRSGRDAVGTAMDQLRNDIKASISPAKEITNLEGLLAGKALAKGLASTDPIVRGQAQEVVNTIETRLAELKGVGTYAGQTGAAAIAPGMASKTGVVSGAADDITGVVDKQLGIIAVGSKMAGTLAIHTLAEGLTNGLGTIRTAGDNVADAYISGLSSGIRAGRTAVASAAAYATAPIRGQSPPKVGPLRHIDDDGEAVGSAWWEGIAKSLERVVPPAFTTPGPLGLSATPGPWPTAGVGSGGPGVVYQVTVQSGVGDPVAIGREVVEAIGAFERSNGREWRA